MGVDTSREKEIDKWVLGWVPRFIILFIFLFELVTPKEKKG